MDFIEIKDIKDNIYKEFIKKILNECEFVLLSSVSRFQIQLGEKIEVCNDWNLFPSNILQDNKLCYFINCFKIDYINSKNFFLAYTSLEELFDLTDIYRIVFIKNSNILVECISDEITIYQ